MITNPTLPALVSLETAKQHLRITDTDHDDDVTQKLEAAQRQILAWLGTRSIDVTWTEGTVPEPIAHSILIFIEALYDREYDRDDTKYQRSLDAIWAMLAPWRYLVIA